MNVPYSEQLEAKNQEISEIFSDLRNKSFLENGAIKPILGAKDNYHYRDKVTSPFVFPKQAFAIKGTSKSSKKLPYSHLDIDRRPSSKSSTKHPRSEVVTGIYAKGTHKVVPVKDCLLENPTASKVVEAVRKIMERHGIEPYDEDTGRGFMRNVIVRVGHKTNEILVTFVTNSEEFPHSKSFCKELISKVPECTTIVQNINTRQTNVILGDKYRVLYGPGFILDELCGMKFRISPGAFYQVNSTQTEVLYEKAIELAKIDEGDSVIDAYCGTGTIGLVACKKHENPLLGLDSSKPAIVDAKMNAKHNGAGNALFIAEDATAFMKYMAAGEVSGLPKNFDTNNMIVFMDPPRSGATEEFLEALITLSPKRIVYISCNPKTQARDCERLCASGYNLKTLQPVDMFPHTAHIESIALLEKQAQTD